METFLSQTSYDPMALASSLCTALLLGRPIPCAQAACNFSSFCEQRKGNGIPLRNTTRIVGMQMVSTVVCRKQLCGMAWVTQDRIEINRPIEFTAAANPVVNLLTYGFPLGSIK